MKSIAEVDTASSKSFPEDTTSFAKFSLGPGSRSPPAAVAEFLGERSLQYWASFGWLIVTPVGHGLPTSFLEKNDATTRDVLEKLHDRGSWLQLFEAEETALPGLAENPWYTAELAPLTPAMHVAALQSMLHDNGYSFANLASAFAKNREDIARLTPFEVTQEVELARGYLRYEREEFFKHRATAASQAARAEFQHNRFVLRQPVPSNASQASSASSYVVTAPTTRSANYPGSTLSVLEGDPFFRQHGLGASSSVAPSAVRVPYIAPPTFVFNGAQHQSMATATNAGALAGQAAFVPPQSRASVELAWPHVRWLKLAWPRVLWQLDTPPTRLSQPRRLQPAHTQHEHRWKPAPC